MSKQKFQMPHDTIVIIRRHKLTWLVIFITQWLKLQLVEQKAHLNPFWHATIRSVSLGNFSSTLDKNWLLRKSNSIAIHHMNKASYKNNMICMAMTYLL